MTGRVELISFLAVLEFVVVSAVVFLLVPLEAAAPGALLLPVVLASVLALYVYRSYVVQ